MIEVNQPEEESSMMTLSVEQTWKGAPALKEISIVDLLSRRTPNLLCVVVLEGVIGLEVVVDCSIRLSLEVRLPVRYDRVVLTVVVLVRRIVFLERIGVDGSVGDSLSCVTIADVVSIGMYVDKGHVDSEDSDPLVCLSRVTNRVDVSSVVNEGKVSVNVVSISVVSTNDDCGELVSNDEVPAGGVVHAVVIAEKRSGEVNELWEIADVLLGCSGNGDERVSTVLDTKGSDDEGNVGRLVISSDSEKEGSELLVSGASLSDVSSDVFDSEDNSE